MRGHRRKRTYGEGVGEALFKAMFLTAAYGAYKTYDLLEINESPLPSFIQDWLDKPSKPSGKPPEKYIPIKEKFKGSLFEKLIMKHYHNAIEETQKYRIE